MTDDQFIRPRLILLTTPLSDADAPAAMRAALAGGDVASVLIDPAGREGDAFQDFAESLMPLIRRRAPRRSSSTTRDAPAGSRRTACISAPVASRT